MLSVSVIECLLISPLQKAPNITTKADISINVPIPGLDKKTVPIADMH